MQKKENKSKKYKMPAGFHVEIDRALNALVVCVNGVISINELEESVCVLKVRGGKISVLGTGIYVSVFENSTVKLYGKITEVNLL